MSRLNSLLSFIALKLSGVRRYSHDDVWCMDRGLGFFAGLNVLPKAAWLTSYSHRVTREMNLQLRAEVCMGSGKVRDSYQIRRIWTLRLCPTGARVLNISKIIGQVLAIKLCRVSWRYWLKIPIPGSLPTVIPISGTSTKIRWYWSL